MRILDIIKSKSNVIGDIVIFIIAIVFLLGGIYVLSVDVIFKITKQKTEAKLVEVKSTEGNKVKLYLIYYNQFLLREVQTDITTSKRIGKEIEKYSYYPIEYCRVYPYIVYGQGNSPGWFQIIFLFVMDSAMAFVAYNIVMDKFRGSI